MHNTAIYSNFYIYNVATAVVNNIILFVVVVIVPRLLNQELTAQKLEEEKKRISCTALNLQANLEVSPWRHTNHHLLPLISTTHMESILSLYVCINSKSFPPEAVCYHCLGSLFEWFSLDDSSLFLIAIVNSFAIT